jgi:hypothetical protein
MHDNPMGCVNPRGVEEELQTVSELTVHRYCRSQTVCGRGLRATFGPKLSVKQKKRLDSVLQALERSRA